MRCCTLRCVRCACAPLCCRWFLGQIPGSRPKCAYMSKVTAHHTEHMEVGLNSRSRRRSAAAVTESRSCGGASDFSTFHFFGAPFKRADSECIALSCATRCSLCWACSSRCSRALPIAPLAVERGERNGSSPPFRCLPNSQSEKRRCGDWCRRKCVVWSNSELAVRGEERPMHLTLRCADWIVAREASVGDSSLQVAMDGRCSGAGAVKRQNGLQVGLALTPTSARAISRHSPHLQVVSSLRPFSSTPLLFSALISVSPPICLI